VTEQAAECSFALVVTAAAVLVIGFEIDALAFATRFPGRAVHSALPIAAGSGRSARSLAYRRAIAAMVQIGAWIDAGHSAGDER